MLSVERTPILPVTRNPILSASRDTGFPVTAYTIRHQFSRCLRNLSPDAVTYLLELLLTAVYVPQKQLLKIDIIQCSTRLEELMFLGICAMDGDRTCVMNIQKLKTFGITTRTAKNKEIMALAAIGKSKNVVLEEEKHEKALLIFSIYNDMRLEFYRRLGREWTPPTLTMSSDNAKLASKISDTLDKYDIEDYRTYIYGVFMRFDWSIVPSLGTLISPNLLDWWAGNRGKVYGEMSERSSVIEEIDGTVAPALLEEGE